MIYMLVRKCGCERGEIRFENGFGLEGGMGEKMLVRIFFWGEKTKWTVCREGVYGLCRISRILLNMFVECFD